MNYNIKICCYAIAADEPHEFIDRWLNSMNGADYICVLITKENNDNWYYFNEKKKEFGNKLIIAQKTISPWRFDVARNESMKLIPEDSDVLVCTDIDEILIPDFWDDLRNMIKEHPDFERIFYRYAWSHNDNGEPKWVFWYDKITQPHGWEWKFPVHESLYRNSEQHNYTGRYLLDKDKIYLHHYPDKNKSRSSYLKLLEQRASEYPDDLYGLYYLAREYTFVQDWEKAASTMYSLYLRISLHPSKDDMRMMSHCLCFLGDCMRRYNLLDDAEYYYKKCIDIAPTCRDGYMKLAQLLAYQPRPQEVYLILEEMQKKSVYAEDWRLTTYYWRDWKLNQIIADAKCWEGKYDEAQQYFDRAVADLKTEDDVVDAKAENLFNDIDWLRTRLSVNS